MDLLTALLEKAQEGHGQSVGIQGEAGLRGATDDVHLAYALEQRRVIVTNDPDFLVLAQEDRPHMVIACCDQGRRSISEIIRRLVLLWERYPAEALRGRIVFL